MGVPIYQPWSIFPWWFSFDAYAPAIFDEAGAIAAGSGLLACGTAIFGSVWRARQSSNVTTYGSARWATRRDVTKAELLSRHGVTLGRIDGDDLRHDGPEHVMAFAPTRSGNHLGTPDEPKVHPVVASVARELLNKSENERSGVLSTAMSFLGLYRDPTVAAVTAASDWRIADLVEAPHPVSLYLVVPPSDISRTKPLVRLVLNQIGRRLTEELHGAAGQSGATRGRHKLLMMLDEFPALGRLDFFETSLAFLAGYGVRAFLIAQSLNQIEKAYGEHNAILDNCHVRIAFATNDERTAKRISDALGTATEQRAMRNYAGHRLAPWLAHVMVSRQETARALLTPGEVMQLAPTDELLLISGHPPIRAKKLRYYQDRRFAARVLPAPTLEGGNYRDLPAPRPDDWADQVRATDIRLAVEAGSEEGADSGGLEQARHPAHEIEPAILAEPDVTDPLGLGEEDGDQAAERRMVDRVQALGVARTVYGLDTATGRPDDLQLEF